MSQASQASLKLAIVEGGLPILIFLPLIRCWGYRHVLPCLVYGEGTQDSKHARKALHQDMSSALSGFLRQSLSM